MMRIVSIILLLGLALAGAMPPGGGLPPAATLNLRSQGWRHVWDGIHGDVPEVGMGLKLRVQLDGRGHVYAGFMVRRLVPLGDKGGTPWIFRVLTVNAQTGAIEGSFDYPTHNVRRNAVLLSNSGKLLVLADDTLQLVAEDGKALAQYRRPPGVFSLEQSSSLATFLIWTGEHGPRIVLDSDTLAIRDSCRTPPRLVPDSISDRRMYYSMEGPHGVPGKNEEAPAGVRFCSSKKVIVPVFPNSQSAFYFSVGDRFEGIGDSTWELWTLPPHRIYLYRLRKHEVYDDYNVRIAANGSRAAFLVIGEKGGSVFFDITPKDVSHRIDVFDLRHPGRIAEIALPFPKKLRRHYDGDYPDFNFSPDGRQLAVLYQGVLRIYNLPEAVSRKGSAANGKATRH